MGGAVLSKATGSEIWSISNLHGDTIATLGSTGVVTGGPFTYDPFGKTISGAPDNQIGSFDNGWLGQHQRPLEQQTGLRAVIEIGARIYDPQLGRFMQTDPIEGGTANDYAYVSDPINESDLTGTFGWRKLFKAAAIVGGIVGAVACGASVVCAIAVGAGAAAASYTASNAGTSRFSWKGLAVETAIGGLMGWATHGIGSKIASSKALSRPFKLPFGRMGRLHFDAKVHPMGIFGNQSHWQMNFWRAGLKGTEKALRFPVWKAF